MHRLWAIAVLCCGCDVVWRIDRVTPDAASGEVRRYIAPGDYDGDGKPNDSDPCPDVAGSADEADRDGDGVGDACATRAAETKTARRGCGLSRTAS